MQAPHSKLGKSPLQRLSPHASAHLLLVPHAQSLAAFVVVGAAFCAQHFVQSAAVFAAFGSHVAVVEDVGFGGGGVVLLDALVDAAGFGSVFSDFESLSSSESPAIVPFESALSLESVSGFEPHAIVRAASAETTERRTMVRFMGRCRCNGYTALVAQ
jgi:hypothetical protein